MCSRASGDLGRSWKKERDRADVPLKTRQRLFSLAYEKYSGYRSLIACTKYGAYEHWKMSSTVYDWHSLS